MLVWWADGTNDSSTKHLTFQVFSFIISYRLRALKTHYFHFRNFVKKIGKNQLKRVVAKNFARFYGKKKTLGTSDAWSMSRLSIGRENQSIIL